MIPLERLQDEIGQAPERSPVVALLGPRQCGKTTAALQTMRESEAVRFDLEDPVDLARLENPMLALGSTSGLVASTTMRRFWTMLAHSHGQVLNRGETRSGHCIGVPAGDSPATGLGAPG